MCLRVFVTCKLAQSAYMSVLELLCLSVVSMCARVARSKGSVSCASLGEGGGLSRGQVCVHERAEWQE